MPNTSTKFDSDLDYAIRLHNLGLIDKAVSHYHNLLGNFPDNPDLWNLLGVVAHQKNQNLLAEKLVKTAISLNPNVPDFHNNLGLVYRGLKQHQEAECAFHESIKLDPRHSNALSNLASLKRQNLDFTAAIDFARKAVQADPQNAEALNNLGNAEKDLGYTKKAVKSYRQAITVFPEFALAHWNLALALLSLGEMKSGFSEMSWRWKWKNFPGIRRDFSQPVWKGENLKGKTIFLHPEQGLGDTIQFMRYAPCIKQLADLVFLELPDAIAPLVRTPKFADKIIIQGNAIPNFDFHVPFMDIPRILETSLDTIPADIPYLQIDKTVKKHWHSWRKKYSGLKIGLNWSGNKSNPAEKLRRVPPQVLTPLSKLPDISWFNLQKGEAAENNDRVSKLFNLIETGPSPLEETAALISVLDLVITTDTAIAHLAGALGKPVWILLHHAPDRRWLTSGNSSRWYPSAKLYRQSSPGNWSDVIENVNQDLLTFSP